MVTGSLKTWGLCPVLSKQSAISGDVYGVHIQESPAVADKPARRGVM